MDKLFKTIAMTEQVTSSLREQLWQKQWSRQLPGRVNTWPRLRGGMHSPLLALNRVRARLSAFNAKGYCIAS